MPVNEFLDCVAVGNDNQWGCTGTLIASKVVLTAGHCADFATQIFIGSDVTQPGKVVKVKRRIRHPQYHHGKHNDLMVLILNEKVEGVIPRKFARKAIIDAATDGRVMGFGNTEATGRFGYGQKQFVDVPSLHPPAAERSTARMITSPTAAMLAWNSLPVALFSRATVARATAVGHFIVRTAISGGCWLPRLRVRPTVR